MCARATWVQPEPTAYHSLHSSTTHGLGLRSWSAQQELPWQCPLGLRLSSFTLTSSILRSARFWTWLWILRFCCCCCWQQCESSALLLLLLLVLSLTVSLQDEDFFHKIPEPSEDELDMLDLAFGLTET